VKNILFLLVCASLSCSKASWAELTIDPPEQEESAAPAGPAYQRGVRDPLGVGTAPARKRPGPQAQKLFHRGVAAYSAARFDDCEDLLGRAIEAYPGWKTASGFRSMCRWTSGDAQGARADALLTERLSPDGAESFAARGFARFVLRRFSGAEEDFQAAARADRKYALARFGLGSVQGRRSRYREALENLDAAVRLAPRAAVIRVVRGTTREKLKDLDGALADYEAALGLAPGFEWVRYYRARVLAAMGRGEQAAEDLALFLKRHPDNADALYLRGCTEFQAGDFRASVRDLDRVLLIDPRRGLAYANRGVARSRMGEREAALEDLEKARKLLPEKAASIDEQIRRLEEKPSARAKAAKEKDEEREQGPSGIAAEALVTREPRRTRAVSEDEPSDQEEAGESVPRRDMGPPPDTLFEIR
jgi:tetratricopeptide (TPR) repeat protein